jgi:hypothetical protein
MEEIMAVVAVVAAEVLMDLHLGQEALEEQGL